MEGRVAKHLAGKQGETLAGVGGAEVELEVEATQGRSVESIHQVGGRHEDARELLDPLQELVYLGRLQTVPGLAAVTQQAVHFVQEEDANAPRPGH